MNSRRSAGEAPGQWYTLCTGNTGAMARSADGKDKKEIQ